MSCCEQYGECLSAKAPTKKMYAFYEVSSSKTFGPPRAVFVLLSPNMYARRVLDIW